MGKSRAQKDAERLQRHASHTSQVYEDREVRFSEETVISGKNQ